MFWHFSSPKMKPGIITQHDDASGVPNVGYDKPFELTLNPQLYKFVFQPLAKLQPRTEQPWWRIMAKNGVCKNRKMCRAVPSQNSDRKTNPETRRCCKYARRTLLYGGPAPALEIIDGTVGGRSVCTRIVHACSPPMSSLYAPTTICHPPQTTPRITSPGAANTTTRIVFDVAG